MNRAGAMMMPLTFSRYADPEGRDANLTRGRDHHEQDGDFGWRLSRCRSRVLCGYQGHPKSHQTGLAVNRRSQVCPPLGSVCSPAHGLKFA